MNEQPETGKEFRKWLEEASPRVYEIRDGDRADLYIKAEKNKDFSYLYHYTTSEPDGVKRFRNFDYAGIFCKSDGLIYDACGEIEKFFPGIEYPFGEERMLADVENRVREMIEEYVSEKYAATDKVALTDKYAEMMNRAADDVLRYKTQKSFLAGIKSDAPYQSDYRFNDRKEDWLLEYIKDKQGYIKRLGEKYIKENADTIAFDYAKYKRLQVELKKLEELADSPLHRLREIRKAVESVTTQKVTVTIEKESQQFTFRASASALRAGDRRWFSPWVMETADRNAFWERFGNGTSFLPEEVTAIYQRNQCIYTAKPFISTEEETESITQKM